MCPKCGAGNMHTIDSRKENDRVRRRRECASCGHRWSTIELSTDTEAEDVAIAKVPVPVWVPARWQDVYRTMAVTDDVAAAAHIRWLRKVERLIEAAHEFGGKDG
jgi:hypothetical protein